MNRIKGSCERASERKPWLNAQQARQSSTAQASPRALLALLLLVFVPLIAIAATPPSWWTSPDVINGAANDYAAINQGQLKNLATKAYYHLQTNVPPNVWSSQSATLRALITGFQTSTNTARNDYAAVNLGQLKTVAQPFYDLLNKVGYTNSVHTSTNGYPWTGYEAQANDYAMANIGQAKNLFSFDLKDYLPLQIKQQIVDADPYDAITAVGQVLPGDDYDGDGLSNVAEYLQESDPNNYYNRGGSTITPVLQIVSGNNQTGNAGSFAGQPLIVQVTDGQAALVNAPVTFSISQGAGKLALANSGAPVTYSSYTMQADASGQVTVYYQFSSNASETQQVSVSAATALPVSFDFSASTQQAADFVVEQAEGSSYQSIQSALDAVTQDNQVIEVKPGTYYERLYFPSYKITLRSTEGAAKTIVNATDPWSQEVGSQVVWINTDAEVAGFTFCNALQGVGIGSGNVRLTNCVIRNNKSDWDGVAIYSSGHLTLVNCSIVFNVSTTGTAAIVTNNGEITLLNTIVWNSTNNEIGLDQATGEPVAVTASFSNVRGSGIYPGQGNINSDPKVRTDGHLSSDSPCVNAGTSSGAPNKDMDGEDRPAGASYDIGADEYFNSTPSNLPDWWQWTYFGSLGVDSGEQSPGGTGLTNEECYRYELDPNSSETMDSNELPYLWESQNFGKIDIDPHDDPDGDGYPNIYEYTHSTNPVDANSKPSPDLIVDKDGNGDTSEVYNVLDLVEQNYTIIQVNPGTYRCDRPGADAPIGTELYWKVLLISRDGASTTIIKPHFSSSAFTVYVNCVIDGFTITNCQNREYGGAINTFDCNTKIVNCIIKDNNTEYSGSAIACSNGKVTLLNCTLLGNQTNEQSAVIQTDNGSISLINSIMWNGDNEFGVDYTTGQISVTAIYSDIKGSSVYPGQGNINVDPLLTNDGHLSLGSPCIDSGKAFGVRPYDIDNETRIGGAGYDIGADEYDGGLPEPWQIKYFGGVGVDPNELSPCADGYTNYQNYKLGIDPINPMDSNGIAYAWELEHFGILHIDPYADLDFDGLSNIGEYLNQGDPNNRDTNGDGILDGVAVITGLPVASSNTNVDSDHDGVIDSLDAFPDDPNKSSGDPGDENPPVIYLNQPINAVLVL